MNDQLNNTRNWTAGSFPPPVFDREGFQKKLDAVCGTARGHSIVRVVWGATEEIDKDKQFTTLGTSAERVRVGRHLTRVPGVPGKVRKRRWIFEEWQPPEQIPQDEGFVRLPGASGLYIPPHVAQEKLEGKWLEIYIVADHSTCLPEVCSSFDFFCFGNYREPSQHDLEKFGRMNYRRKALALDAIDPFEPMSDARVEKFNREAIETVAEMDGREDAEDQEFYADAEKTLSRVSTSG